ncbi:MAG: hypothetical protein NTW32_20660 [Chloroflexi bacterium]|nr:hypothetical protein [Chloroflexota bacterium]
MRPPNASVLTETHPAQDWEKTGTRSDVCCACPLIHSHSPINFHFVCPDHDTFRRTLKLPAPTNNIYVISWETGQGLGYRLKLAARE